MKEKVNEDAEQGPTHGTTEDRTELSATHEEEILEESQNDEEDCDLILYEAFLDYTELERSNTTACKLNCISVIIIILASVLFVFSFPFSLFLVLFWFNTKRACLPCQSIQHSPWKLYLTSRSLHYHLPNPPQRPYINIFYCLERAYKFTISFEDIRSISVESASIHPSSNTNTEKLENVIIELKPGSPGIRAPTKNIFGVWSRLETLHTMVIYSVKDASAFMEAVEDHMRRSAA